MCSIFAILDFDGDLQTLRQLALRQSRLMRHRGPDWSGIHTCEGAVLAHERLVPDLYMKLHRHNHGYATGLAYADYIYMHNDDTENKERAALHIRLLLADDRVDPHLMLVRHGYATV